EQDAPAAGDNATGKPDGDPHALQDDRPRTPDAGSGTVRAAAKAADAAADRERLRGGVAAPAPRMDEGAPPGSDGERREPAFERGAGAAKGGAEGRLAERVLDGGGRAGVAGRGTGVLPASYAARVTASRGRSLFDLDLFSHADPLPPDPPPPGA